MTILVGNLVLVHEYGSDPHWMEVVDVTPTTVTCFNGHDDYFEIDRKDIKAISTDESVLK